MVDTNLFEAEMAALNRAQATVTAPGLDASQYRQALEDLVRHYQRLMRETHRLIRHGDRSEAELNAANTRLQQLSAELDYKARHDSLTGTLNRRAIFEKAQNHLQHVSMSLIILDIDFFKEINDSCGHPAGDAVLKELAERLFSILNGQGSIGRVGGEEFTILLPETGLRDALHVAEAIRRGIADQPFSSVPERRITASFGVGWNERHTDFALAYSSTDAALYRAKNKGRNQVAF
ncbi:MAG: GGDEF domain-containing protein [Burkholderiaceae bacterium]